MKLFVPGRICLFGEHSDWAGGYRRINGALEKGYTLLCGTNHGVHAEVKPHPTKFILRSTLADDAGHDAIELPMERDALLAKAGEGGLFSYAAGVACQVMTHYRVRGLEIDNYLTDLPVRKGLSSSAAVCVLVARAFNRIYDLKMTTRGEMEFAYLGEITTPSRCGRMDQGCAYGNRPIMMVFDGERLDVVELSVKRDLHYVIVDLRKGKDTKKILNDLNHCYPFATGKVEKGVQKYLGPISAAITQQAAQALRDGDAPALGALMTRAQAEFDRHLQPACPDELTAPVLHKVLAYAPIQSLILGGKGVGSQGDGTAQFLVKDRESQQKVKAILEHDLGMPCLDLVIRAAARTRKAIVPAAGFGTRLFPATKAVKKELFPILDRDGRVKPVMLAIVEEALNAGVEEIGIIVQRSDRGIFEEFFGAPPAVENFNKLSKENQKYTEYLLDIGRRIHFVYQDVQEGFGHAVHCAKDWVGDEPFLLLLGDHLYASATDASCGKQMLDAFARSGQSLVGLQVTPGAEVSHFGCVTGIWQKPGEVLSITEFCEKPTLEYARKHLRVEGLEEDTYLTVFGMYVLKPLVFQFLDEHIAHGIRERGEFQLTSCLEKVRQVDGFAGYVIKGRRFDVGLPEAYRQTLIEYPLAGPRPPAAPAPAPSAPVAQPKAKSPANARRPRGRNKSR
jgi:UTP-glucose-1-phosphate uridylyltransferase/mevalonate kinase